jgi:hypothetical protein
MKRNEKKIKGQEWRRKNLRNETKRNEKKYVRYFEVFFKTTEGLKTMFGMIGHKKKTTHPSDKKTGILTNKLHHLHHSKLHQKGTSIVQEIKKNNPFTFNSIKFQHHDKKNVQFFLWQMKNDVIHSICKINRVNLITSFSGTQPTTTHNIKTLNLDFTGVDFIF